MVSSVMGIDPIGCWGLHIDSAAWCVLDGMVLAHVSPGGEKDITQVSGTCGPRSIRGGGMFPQVDLALI